MDGTSSIEEILEARDLLEKYKTLQKKGMGEIDAKIQALDALQQQVRGIVEQFSGMNEGALEQLKEQITKADQLKASLDERIAALEKEKAGLVSELDGLKEAVKEKDRQLGEKDDQIKNKDAEITSLSQKLQGELESSGSTTSELQERITALTKDLETARLKEQELLGQIDEIKSKYDGIKTRLRDSGDSVLGTTMELERYKKDLEEKDARVKELEEQLGTILTGETGVFTTTDKLVELLKEKLGAVHRSVRLCVPSLSLLEEKEFLPVLQGYPRTATANIAADIAATDEHIVLDLKNKGMAFTQFDLKDRWLLNRDGEELIIALEKGGGAVIGFYTNEPLLVSMFNSVIMEPWIKGIKI